jgi:hypothetical protein
VGESDRLKGVPQGKNWASGIWVNHVGLKMTSHFRFAARVATIFDALKKAGLLHHAADSQGLKFPKRGQIPK